MSSLTAFQERKVRHLFAVYDRRGNGYLEREDWEHLADEVAVASGHPQGSPGHVRITRRFLTQFERYKAVADFSRDGRIAIDEWVDFFEIVLSDPSAFEAVVGGTLRLILRAFDVDDDAMLDRRELEGLRRVFRIDGKDAGLFEALDRNGDGLLCATEVRRAIETYFRSDDPEAAGNRLFGEIS